MKRALLILLMLSTIIGVSQSKKPIDNRPQIEKEDSNNMYNQSEMSTLDLLQALELASVRVFKFDIGTFDKEYKLEIFADEYIKGKLVNSNILVDFTNDYGFWIDEEYNQGFIDQIKIFTKTEENESVLNIRTYALSTKKEISLAKTDDRQFYNWRTYEKTKWQMNEKVPLLIFASSWLDKKYDFHRFCGVVKLKEDDKATQELLDNSPNYIVINYKISEAK